MIVSKTNIARLATITATPDSSLQDINAVTDGDYSSTYIDALTESVRVLFEFAEPQKVGYIAIAGNVSSKTRITIYSQDTSQPIGLISSDNLTMVSSDNFYLKALYENQVDDSLLGQTENKVMMYRVDIPLSYQVEVEIFGGGSIAISEIAMGEYYEIPRGEQAGYQRPWTVPNKSGRSASSLNQSPIALSYEARAISTSLSVPNNIMTDFDGWYEFIDFASNNTFYVLEDNNKFHSYAGFNAVPGVTAAHSQTRELGVSSIKFSAYAKASGFFG